MVGVLVHMVTREAAKLLRRFDKRFHPLIFHVFKNSFVIPLCIVSKKFWERMGSPLESRARTSGHGGPSLLIPYWRFRIGRQFSRPFLGIFVLLCTVLSKYGPIELRQGRKACRRSILVSLVGRSRPSLRVWYSAADGKHTSTPLALVRSCQQLQQELLAVFELGGPRK